MLTNGTVKFIEYSIHVSQVMTYNVGTGILDNRLKISSVHSPSNDKYTGKIKGVVLSAKGLPRKNDMQPCY